MQFFAASVLAAITRASPAFGDPAPITLVDVQAEADHGRHLDKIPWSRSCNEDKPCVGVHAGAQCVYNKCRKEWKDCRATDKPGFGCAYGKECVPKKFKINKDKMNTGKNWGKCKRLPTMAEIDTKYVRHDDMYMHSKGLVNFEDGHNGAGARVDFFSSGFQDGTLLFSFDQFTRYCVDKCTKLDTCTAVSVTDWMASKDRTCDFGKDVDTQFSCELLNTRIEVRGVQAAMLGPSPSFRTVTGTSGLSHSNEAMLDEKDVVFVKKGFDVKHFESCDVNYAEMESSLGCLLTYNSVDGTFSKSIPDMDLPPASGPGVWESFCQALIGYPTEGRDFWTKVAPAIGCLESKAGGCLECMSHPKYIYTDDGKKDNPKGDFHGPLTVPADPRFALDHVLQYSAAETVCAPPGYKHNDHVVPNAIRETCKEECYDEKPQCEEDLQTALLCVLGSNVVSDSVLPPDETFLPPGEITFPYKCPP